MFVAAPGFSLAPQVSSTFVLSVVTLSKHPPRHVVCHCMFPYSLCEARIAAYLDFIKSASHTFPDVPELLSADRWGFPADYFLTLASLSSITSSSHSDYCYQKAQLISFPRSHSGVTAVFRWSDLLWFNSHLGVLETEMSNKCCPRGSDEDQIRCCVRWGQQNESQSYRYFPQKIN